MRLPHLLVLLLLASLSCTQSTPKKDKHAPSHAGESLRLWAMARSFPDGSIHTEKYAEALAQIQFETKLTASDRSGNWEAIGPKNIGGRTLCLAFHPLDTNIIYAGSASGGLWKTTTAGQGPDAWHYVETGFPVLGVSAIAIDPNNPNVLYIGTGEVYNLDNSMPNVAFRTTRGTYGIGILKSTDGGLSWSKSLDWAYGDLRGVQDIKINPRRARTLYAATTEGLLRSYNAGASWQTVHNRKMAVDIEINPIDTGTVFVTHGSLDDELVSGVFRSTDGGNTFSLLNNGIPAGYSGKTLLTICPGQPNMLYASVGNNFFQQGLFKTTDGGNSWALVNNEDVCAYQGWYSHDVAVHPTNPDTLIWVGIDTWKSVDGGLTVSQQTLWYAWTFGQVPAGGPEGPPYYVHADIHRAYWMQNDPNKVYSATDGGIFVSYDGGTNWQGRNGGYQTQQFYANLGNSTTNPNLCIGGMQDNATAIYTGDAAWTRVLGGDGECAGIYPGNDLILFGSSQYLNLYKSIDGGENFSNITTGDMQGEDAAFNGPFEFAPSDPDIMYAGAQSLFRSDNAGEFWNYATTGFLADGDVILTLAVHPQNPNLLLCSTAPSVTNTARVFRVNTATGQVAQATGLPNRLCMDIAYDPVNPDVAYAVFSGFNTGHVWRSTDGGSTWTNTDNSLPDVPANSVLVDPLFPSHLYLGTDLGVWLSRTGGASWEFFSTGAPSGMLAMHLSISADRQLRVATHGLGVWQTPLAEPVSTKAPIPALNMALRPNPAATQAAVEFDLPKPTTLDLWVVTAQGREIYRSGRRNYAAGRQTIPLDCSAWPAGAYGIVLEGAAGRTSRVLVKR